MFKIVDIIVKLVVFISFFTGLWMLVGNWIISGYKAKKTESRFKRHKSHDEKKKENFIFEHLDNMLNTTNGKFQVKPITFLVFTGLIFIGVFMLLFEGRSSLVSAIVISIVMSLTPYFSLLIRLWQKRIDGSYEGEYLVMELINQYKLSSFNMIEAIDKTAIELKNYPYSQRLLYQMALSLKDIRHSGEVEAIVKKFVFGFDTEWAIQIGMNIQIAIVDKSRVTNSLEDVLNELKQVRTIIEKNQRSNNESFSIIRLMLVPAYFGTAYTSIAIFGFTVNKFLTNQFRTELGLKFAMLLFPSIAFCFMILKIAQKPKYDI